MTDGQLPALSADTLAGCRAHYPSDQAGHEIGRKKTRLAVSGRSCDAWFYSFAWVTDFHPKVLDGEMAI
jgi:hypothetical protein